MEKMRKEVMRDLSFMSYAPVLFISAKTGQRTDRIFELVNFVNDQSNMRITTGMLNDVLADAQARVQPPTDKGRRLKIYYMTQTGIKPPNFVIFCNSRELFHFSYQRYIENQIRAVFGLEGTPIRMVIRQKGISNDSLTACRYCNNRLFLRQPQHTDPVLAYLFSRECSQLQSR